MKRWSRRNLFLLVALVVTAGLPAALAGSDPVTDGRVWLEGDQNADGSWGVVLPTIVTGTALETLTTLDVCAVSIIPGADWLSSQEVDNHEFLARQIMGLSEATGFESTARLLALDRLRLKMDLRAWVDQALRLLAATTLLISHEVAIEAYRLPEPFHRDPADRLLVATARIHALHLVTADELILEYPGVPTIDARS